MQKELGITTIYVTHDQAEALSMADKIGVTNKDKIMQIDGFNELYSRSTNLFIPGFIGFSANEPLRYNPQNNKQ